MPFRPQNELIAALPDFYILLDTEFIPTTNAIVAFAALIIEDA